jgi:two-component system chemotaxis response regulator CheY
MPNMDGMELIRSLRDNPGYKELPIIILTSLNESKLKSESENMGVHSYLNKPFSLEKVQYEVSKYLSWSE